MAGLVPDAFWVEWHPTCSPLLDVGSGDWVTIANGIRELACSHGFDRELARVEAGSATVVFDNRDRSLDPLNPHAPNYGGFTPLRHVRIRATTGATTLTIWRGFTTKWTPDWLIDDAWVVLEAVDSLAAAARMVRDSTLDVAIRGEAPDMWVPLDDGGTRLAQGADAASQDAVMSNTTAQGNILPFADQPSTTFAQPGLSKGDLAMATLPYSIDYTGFTLLAVFRAEAPEAQVILANGPDPATGACPSGDIALTVDIGNTYSLRVGNDSGSTLVTFPRPHADPSTMVIARYNETQTTLWASYGYFDVGGNSVLNADHGGTFTPRGGVLRVGAGLDAANANPFLGQLSHVASWNRELDDTECETLYSGYFGCTQNGYGVFDHGDDVINWVLDRLGIPAGRRILDTGVESFGGTANDLTALAMMSRAAATERGYFFADREGNYVFRLPGTTGTHRGTYDTRPGGTGHAAAADMKVGNDDRTFFTVARLQVTTAAEPQTVEYRHANADSSTGYGEVVYDPPTTFDNVDDALAAGTAAVGDATPKLGIVEVTVQMGAPNVDPAALLASDVLDQCDTVARIPGLVGSPPALLPHEQTGTIVQVAHAFARERHWRTVWSVVPED